MVVKSVLRCVHTVHVVVTYNSVNILLYMLLLCRLCMCGGDWTTGIKY